MGYSPAVRSRPSWVHPSSARADDLEESITALIAGASESLDIAVQELDSLPIAQAILDARGRGVSVRIIPEQTVRLPSELVWRARNRRLEHL